MRNTPRDDEPAVSRSTGAAMRRVPDGISSGLPFRTLLRLVRPRSRNAADGKDLEGEDVPDGVQGSRDFIRGVGGSDGAEGNGGDDADHVYGREMLLPTEAHVRTQSLKRGET